MEISDKNVFSLSGNKIFITGASSGIGKSIALECAKNGGQLFLTGRNEKALADTFDKMIGSKHEKYILDLIKHDDIETVIKHLPKLDGIVLNAGIFIPKLFSFNKKTEINQIFNTNLFGNIHLIQKLIEHRKLNNKASIVFISSIAGNTIAAPGSSIYGASKAAINGLAKSLALELSKKKIRVNTISPGMIETDLLKNSAITGPELKEDLKKYPLGRYGKPEDVSYATIFMLSRASQWITGSNLIIDGGFTLK